MVVLSIASSLRRKISCDALVAFATAASIGLKTAP
jgi:hypothetical protein